MSAPAPEDPSPPASSGARPSRLPALDALRGIAILLVLLYHFAPQGVIISAPGRAVLTVLRLGWVGVDLFFVLSGFLITGILLDGRGTPGTLGRFYGRRALRILPLYYGTLATLLVVTLVMRRAGTGQEAGAAFMRDQAWYWLHAANVAVARTAWWGEQSSVTHFWSLAVEEQFYLLWPAAVLLFPRRWLPRTIAALVLGAFATRVLLVLVAERPIAAYVLTPARADALAMGALLALAWRTPAWHARATRLATLFAPLSAAVLFAIIATQGPGSRGLLMATVGHSTWALLFASLLWLAIVPAPSQHSHHAMAAVTARWRTWLERRRGLHLLARYSYGLYVVHIPVRQWLSTRGITGIELVHAYGEWLGGALTLAIGVLASLAVAVPLWHLYEAPIMARGGAWLDARLRPRRAVVARRLVPTPIDVAAT